MSKEAKPTDILSDKSLSGLASVGISYFALFLIFSIVFFKERLMADGSYKVFEMCNSKWFPYTSNRFVIWLTHFLPVAAVNMNLTLKTVINSWIINYYIFYLLCFAIVLYYFKDWVSAAMIICTHAFTMGTSFYNLADEILPSVVLAILLFSLLKSQSPKVSGIIFLLFFIAFSHLLAIFSIFMVGLYFLITESNEAYLFFQKNKYWLILFSGLFLIRIALAFSDPYENGRMSVNHDRLNDFLQHLNVQYFIVIVTFITKVESVVCIFFIILLWFLFKKRKWVNILSLICLLSVYVGIWLFYVDPASAKYINPYDHLTIRWFFPFCFTIISIFLHTSYSDKGRWMQHWVLYGLLSLALVTQYLTLYIKGDTAINTVRQFEILQKEARRQGLQKCFISSDSICRNVYYHTVTTSSIIYSALAGADSCIHVVVYNKGEDQQIRSLEGDIFYQSSDRFCPTSELNRKYFKLNFSKYEPLNDLVDCSDIR